MSIAPTTLRIIEDVTPKDAKIIAVHDGIFHADEIFAIALLSIIFEIAIVRSRDPERLKTADMRVDVGGIYNPDTEDFDHHQAGFNERHKSPNSFKYDEGPLRSGFGLVFLKYGKQAIKKLIANADDWEVDEIFNMLDRNIVSAIDCSDNGENDKFRAKDFPYSNVSISRFISLLNPSNEPDENTQMSAFYTARNIASMYLIKEIQSTANMVLSVKIFNEKAKDLGNKEILVLDTYIPYGYAYNKSEYATDIEMIVFPALGGNWMCATPKYYYNRDYDNYPSTLKNGQPRIYKHQAPEEICGLRDEELAEKVGIKDAVFIHINGHLGACKTKEGAIELAKYFIDKGRN